MFGRSWQPRAGGRFRFTPSNGEASNFDSTTARVDDNAHGFRIDRRPIVMPSIALFEARDTGLTTNHTDWRGSPYSHPFAGCRNASAEFGPCVLPHASACSPLYRQPRVRSQVSIPASRRRRCRFAVAGSVMADRGFDSHAQDPSLGRGGVGDLTTRTTFQSRAPAKCQQRTVRRKYKQVARERVSLGRQLRLGVEGGLSRLRAGLEHRPFSDEEIKQAPPPHPHRSRSTSLGGLWNK